jgi:hypothetical protein
MVVALLRPSMLDLIDFQAVLLLLQENRRYKDAHVLIYLSLLDIALRPNGKFEHVLGNSMGHFQKAI